MLAFYYVASTGSSVKGMVELSTAHGYSSQGAQLLALSATAQTSMAGSTDQ